jgi:hypothetical protein
MSSSMSQTAARCRRPLYLWEIQQGAPATRLAFSALYKFRDNGPNYSLKIGEPELGRGPAFKPFWVWRASNYSAIFLTRRLID